MKPLRPPVYLLHFLLLGLSLTLVILGFFFGNHQLVIWPNPFGLIHHGEAELPLMIGIIDWRAAAFFLAFVFQYLAYEFYGYRTAFYSVLTNAIMMALLGGIFWGLKIASTRTGYVFFDDHILSLYPYTLKQSAAILISYVVGYLFLYTLCSILKKITFNYFMFIRYVLAGSLGFAVILSVEIYIKYYMTYSLETMLMYAITPASQHVIMLMGSLIPLYLVRLVLGLFRGRLPKALRDNRDDTKATPHEPSNPKDKKSWNFFGKKSKVNADPNDQNPDDELTPLERPHAPIVHDDRTERIRTTDLSKSSL